MPEASIAQEAYALGEGSRRRVCIWRCPTQRPPRGVIVHLPPFAEEMNKCRRMVALAARALAREGFAVLQTDLHGCGDSAGEFGDASWDSWLADAACAIEHARSRSDAPLWLWGVRAGALLVAPSLRTCGVAAGVLLWQPVVSGSLHLTQFLRLQIAADMMSAGSERGGTKRLKEALAAGEALEIAGYRLSPALASGLEAARFDPDHDRVTVLVWLEVSGTQPPALVPASRSRIEELQRAGFAVTADAVAGPPFWQTVEIEECADLVGRTVALVSAAHGAPNGSVEAPTPSVMQGEA